MRQWDNEKTYCTVLYSNPRTNCIIVRPWWYIHFTKDLHFTSLPVFHFLPLSDDLLSQFKSLHFTTIFHYRNHVWPLNVLQYCTHLAALQCISSCYIPNRYRRRLLCTVLLHVLPTLSLMWFLSPIRDAQCCKFACFSQIFCHFLSPVVMFRAIAVRLVFWFQLFWKCW